MARCWWVFLFAAPALAAEVPPLPDKEGFAGCFAGVSHGALIVAGGANFPDKKPWEGGTKAWYDDVYVLEPNAAKWKPVGKLPRAMGYGVSVTYKDSVIVVGGADAKRHYLHCFRMEWIEGRLKIDRLPPLPKDLAYACGAIVGDVLYVAGGNEKPDGGGSDSVFRIDLSAKEPAWQAVEGAPKTPRFLAVAAAYDDKFWLMSGVVLVHGMDGKPVRKYLTDAHCYSPNTGWKRIADVPRPVTAAPSPAPTSANGFFILGGDDGTQVGVAPDKHRGFPNAVLQYDAKADRWIEAGKFERPRVTTPCVPWGQDWIIPSGEIRPGVRTPDVATFPLPK